MDDMIISQDLTDELHDLLAHLYDPMQSFPHSLGWVFRIAPDQGTEEVQRAVIRAIRDLRPGRDVPEHARVWRLYRLLECRYLEQVTQEEAAERLGITVRHLSREQTRAIQLLALTILREGQSEPTAELDRVAVDSPSPQNASELGNSYVKRELAALEKQAPGATCGIRDVLERTVRTTKAFAAKRNVTIVLAHDIASCQVRVHDSVLSQALVGATTHLIQGMSSGEIELAVHIEPREACIVITGSPTTALPPAEKWLSQTLISAQGGSIDSQRWGDSLQFRIHMPTSRRITILIVDDNEDLAHFYQLCTVGTMFHAVHLREGRKVFPTIESVRPEIIVLDLMLPDIDGWELLAQLHEHPLSRAIPVVVCSVVRERELALALGAAAYIAKPVRRADLIRMLSQIASQVGPAEMTAPESNSVVC